MKVYIAGPITGMEDYMSRFQKAEERLRKEGFIPYNPASVSAMLPEETTYEEYMDIALTLLDMCEAIFLLQGWEKSLGANREYGYALAKDMVILRQEKKSEAVINI